MSSVKKWVAAAAATSIVAIAIGAGVASAAEPQIGTQVRIVGTGTAPFDDTAADGADVSADDRIVRSLDVVSYEVGFQFNEAADLEKVVTVTVTNGAILAVPPSCLDGAVSADETHLRCVVGSSPASGMAGTIPVNVRAGAAVNGAQITMQATVEAGTTTVGAVAEPVVITATPRWDLAANKQALVGRTSERLNPVGHDAYVILTPVTVEADLTVGDGRGTEGLTGDLAFDLDYSVGGDPSIPWELAGFDVAGLVPAASGSCGPAAMLMANGVPFGRIGITDAATPASSVTDSGSWTCTQPGGPGTTIHVAVTGAALSTAHFPDAAFLRVPVAPRRVLVAGTVAVVVDAADVNRLAGPDGGVVPVTWAASGFDPVGLSGRSNYGDGTEPEWNNHGRANVSTFPSGLVDGFIMGDYGEARANHPVFGLTTFFDTRPPFLDPSHNVYVPSQTQDAHAGDGTVTPGQTFTEFMSFGGAENRPHPDTNAVMCTAVDTATTSVIDMPRYDVTVIDMEHPEHLGMATGERIPQPLNGSPVKVRSTSDASADWWLSAPMDDSIRTVVEYGTGPATESCGDGASATGWTTDPATTPGAHDGVYPAVSMVRVRTLDPVRTDGMFVAWVALRAKPSASPWLVTRFASGTWAPNRSWTGDAEVWSTGPYDPELHDAVPLSDVHFGDRLRLATRTMVVTDDILGGDPGDLTPSSTVTFRLTATAFGAAANSVRLTDQLPEGLELVTASPPPTRTSGRTAQWDVPQVPGDSTITVDVTARVTSDAPTGAGLVNQASVTADDLSPDGNVLSAWASVRTARAFARLEVTKTALRPTVPVEHSVDYRVRLRNVANVPLTNVRWIDVLPYNRDQRTPATSFAGRYDVLAPTVDPGVVVTYTAASSATIDDDPNAATNADGRTTWCAAEQFGTDGCPASFGDVTGLQFSVPRLDPGQQTATDVTLLPTGNNSGDTYTNRVAARADQIPLVARSSDSSVGVVAAPTRALAGTSTTAPSPFTVTSPTTVPLGESTGARPTVRRTRAETAAIVAILRVLRARGEAIPLSLAFTGAGAVGSAAVAVGLVGAGVVALVVRRRLRRD